MTRFNPHLLAVAILGLASSAGAQPVNDPALKGAIDIHSHVDPDGYGPGHNGRAWLGRRARVRRGHAAAAAESRFDAHSSACTERGPDQANSRCVASRFRQ